MSLFIFSTAIIAESAELIHVIRFSDYESGSEKDWLLKKGFEFQLDARDPTRIDFNPSNKGLVIQAKRKALGIISNEIDIPEFTYVEIDWGVNKHPEGASYEQGVRNEAIMVMIFMGDEHKASGSLFIPDAPYFVGLFLCHGDDRLNHPYLGSYFKKGGRYVCADRPGIGEMVTTRFDLLNVYRSYFDKEKEYDTGISGISLALDTKKAGNNGQSSAFISEIRFYN